MARIAAGRLERHLLHAAHVDSKADESTHVVFSLQTGREVATAGELGIRSVFKVYVTFPRPRACRAVLINDPAERLFTVRFLYSVSCFFCTWIFHSGYYPSLSAVGVMLLPQLTHTTQPVSAASPRVCAAGRKTGGKIPFRLSGV